MSSLGGLFPDLGSMAASTESCSTFNCQWFVSESSQSQSTRASAKKERCDFDCRYGYSTLSSVRHAVAAVCQDMQDGPTQEIP